MADLEYTYGKVGLPGAALQGEGVRTPIRLGRTGETAFCNAHGLYHEPTSRGAVFSVCSQAGVTSQAGLSVTTPVLTLYNPIGSGVNLSLIFAGGTVTVAAATAGAVWLAANTNTAAAAVTGTATTAHRCGLFGGGTPKASPLLAATLPAAPVATHILGTLLTGAITTAIATPNHFGRYFDGDVILKENTAVSIQTGVASGASGLFCEFVWEEVPNA